MPTTTKPAGKRRGFSVAGMFKSIGKFFKEVVAELKRVSWPEKKELISYTIAVIVFVAIMAAIVGLLDMGFGLIFKTIVQV